jgi:hypothetical protein
MTTATDARTIPERYKPTARQEEEHVRSQASERAYARWLRARGAIKDTEAPDDESVVTAQYAEERAAIRALFSLPAAGSECVWQKFEALETELTDEREVGEAGDDLVMFGLGAIKADLVNLGIGAS